MRAFIASQIVMHMGLDRVHGAEAAEAAWRRGGAAIRTQWSPGPVDARCGGLAKEALQVSESF
jgi:hypothetical protein